MHAEAVIIIKAWPGTDKKCADL